jgi:quercetin dioxygenase-like cupin family protein
MRRRPLLVLGAFLVLAALTAEAEEVGLGRPQILLRESVQSMPTGPTQEVRVLTATLKPGEKTPFHTHRFPVTVYILEGAFTLEMAGRAPVTVTAGQAMVDHDRL